MKSGKQIQQRVTNYLHEVGQCLPAMPREERDAMLRRLKDRIDLDLTRFKEGPAPDDLDVILAEYGDPEDAALRLSRNGQAAHRGFLEWDNRLWLGVCGGIARQFDVNPMYVRAVIVLLCFIPPLIPLLLVGYLGTFFYFYFAGEREHIGGWNPMASAYAAGIAIGIGVVLHMAGKLMVWVIAKGYAMLSGQGFSVDPRWNWIVYESGGLLFWALAICIPLAVLSGMPLSKGWKGTVKKVYQAGLALYGVFLCYGIAGLFVSLAIRMVGSATEGGQAETIYSIFDELSQMAQ